MPLEGIFVKKAPPISSRAGDFGGAPALFVNGAPFPAAAYMTYLEEYGDWRAFAEAGYRLFSVPVLFAGRWISATERFRPFHAGIFDQKDSPDFSSLDASVARILAACPEAYIIPRVNLSMPLWWVREHPRSVDGAGVRELLFAPEYRETAAGMLRETLRHICGSPYASHIAALQLAGGNTEEWFHFDLRGGCCENAVPAFHAYLEKHRPGCGFSGLPDLSLLKGAGPYHNSAHLRAYLDFANESVAETVCLLCAAAKEETGGRLAVGVFYGYSLEVASPLYGTHALGRVLDCESVDFICSPNSYIGVRDPAADWTEMYPADSVRLHGKLCMQECDIRTFLTRPLYEAAPEYDPGKNLAAPIWQGLASKELSLDMLRKAFCRQLVKGNGFWWFDMWGGWYRDPDLMAELGRMRAVYAAAPAGNRAGVSEIAVFTDETANRDLTECGLRNLPFEQRRALGVMGAPYDIYDLRDFGAVCGRYRAVLFASAVPTEDLRRAADDCRKNGIPCLSAAESLRTFTAAELRALCRAAGVHIWCETDDIVYVNESFIAVCAVTPGEKTLRFGRVRAFRELLSGSGLSGVSDTVRLTLRANETRLFALG